jgi:hypothetical protein
MVREVHALIRRRHSAEAPNLRPGHQSREQSHNVRDRSAGRCHLRRRDRTIIVIAERIPKSPASDAALVRFLN